MGEANEIANIETNKHLIPPQALVEAIPPSSIGSNAQSSKETVTIPKAITISILCINNLPQHKPSHELVVKHLEGLVCLQIVEDLPSMEKNVGAVIGP